MFTGLVEDLGQLEAREDGSEGSRLRIKSRLGAELALGDSVAVNGACLTATEVDETGFSVEVMNQTLALTALGDLKVGDALNLELAAQLGDRMGGHLVQGHVDGVVEVMSVQTDGFARRLRVKLPAQLARYTIDQGSVTLNGVSLTIAALSPPDAEPSWLEVSLIPETLQRTNLGTAEPGTVLNMECDVIARYVERLSQTPSPHPNRN
jgi:riboflavin synthase